MIARELQGFNDGPSKVKTNERNQGNHGELSDAHCDAASWLLAGPDVGTCAYGATVVPLSNAKLVSKFKAKDISAIIALHRPAIAAPTATTVAASVHIHTDNFGPPILHSMRLGRRSLNFAHVPVVYPGHLPIVPGDRDCIPTCFGDNAAISGIASPVDAGTLLEILRFAYGHCCSTGCLGSHT